MKILSTWKKFFLFLRSPSYISIKEGLSPKMALTFYTLILLILLLIPLIIIHAIYTGFLDEVPRSIHENVIHLYPPVILCSMVAVFEEFSFRGFISKFNPLLFAISITGIITIYFKKITFHNMMFEPEGLLEVALLVMILFPLAFIFAQYNGKLLKRLWKKNFRVIFYTSAFLFAFIHFFNSVDLSLTYLPSTIFQFLMALIFGFVRIRAGIFYAIIVHFIWNLSLLLMTS